MKKILSIALSVILILSITHLGLFSLTASAYTEGTEDYYTYTVENDEATITNVDESINGDITIPSTLGGCLVTNIEDYAFSDCTSLKSITIPDSVTNIGDSAFYNCSSLTNITIPDSVTSIGYGAFSGCSSLESITIPNSVTNIGDSAFSYCSSLTNITIPDSVTSIGYGVFYDCDSLTSVTIPESVTDIGESAFGNCKSLKSIKLPKSVTNIGELVFYNCTGLTSVIIPDSITSIAPHAFMYCYSLTSITIPASVTSIGSSAFFDCDSLTDVYITDLSAWCKIDFGDYESNPLNWYSNLYLNGELVKNLIIPNDVTFISNYAFYGYDNLIYATIPDSITSIGEGAFPKSTVLYGYKTSSAFREYVTSYNNDFAYLDGTDEECIVSGKVGKYNWSIDKLKCELVISGSGNMVDFISVGAPWSQYWKFITKVTLSNGVTDMGKYAFKDLYYFKTVDMPNTLTSIGEDAFSSCSSLESITIPNSVTSIGNNAFFYCKSLTNITIPDSVTSIGNGTFSRCNNLESITIPNSVTCIGDYAFQYCGNLKSITIPNSVTSIGYRAFYNCDSLKEVILPFGIEGIYSGTFGDCDSLKKAVIYNKNCDFSSDCGLNYNHTIYGFKGSTAEDFAEQIGAEFIDIMTIHSHTFDKGVITKKSTCKEAGVKTYTCSVCKSTKNETIAKLTTHTYSNNCDKFCNVCGATRTVGAHKYSNTCDTTCNYCNAKRTIKHTYTNSCDTTCNVCKSKRTIKHTYSNSCDTTCNVCKAKRTIKHIYSNNCDTSCNVCKATRAITHSYKTTTTKATLSKNGSIVKKCTVCGKVASSTAIKYAKTFKLSTTSYTYDGKIKTPSVTVKDSAGKTLKKNTDYTVTYASGRKNVGTYKVTIKMIGKYSGTKTLTFKINPAKTTVSKLTAGKKSITVAITKKSTQVTGYQIQYSTSKTFSKSTTKTISSYKTTKYTLKSLSAKKTYYIRVRTYKKIGNTTYYSGWSTYKYVKTK